MTDTYRRHLGGRLPPPSVRATLDLLCRGYTYKEIARALGRSPDTVKNQLQAGRRLLDCRSSVEVALVWSQMRTGDGSPDADRRWRGGHAAPCPAERLLMQGYFE